MVASMLSLVVGLVANPSDPSPILAAKVETPAPYMVPHDRRGSFVFVHATVKKTPLKLLLDSGADGTIVRAKFFGMDDLVRSERRVMLVRVGEIERAVDVMLAAESDPLVTSLKALFPPDGPQGILGADFLRTMLMGYDIARGDVAFFPVSKREGLKERWFNQRRISTAKGDIWIPADAVAKEIKSDGSLSDVSPLPGIAEQPEFTKIALARKRWYLEDFRVNGNMIPLLIDTGAMSTVLPNYAKTNPGNSPGGIQRVATVYGVKMCETTRVKSTHIGRYEFKRIALALPFDPVNDFGLLGMDYLGQLRLLFDFEENRVTFTTNSSFLASQNVAKNLIAYGSGGSTLQWTEPGVADLSPGWIVVPNGNSIKSTKVSDDVVRIEWAKSNH